MRTHFHTQVAEEFFRVWQLIPNLGEKCSSAETILQNDAVHAWMQRFGQVFGSIIMQGHWFGQAGDFNFDSGSSSGRRGGKRGSSTAACTARSCTSSARG